MCAPNIGSLELVKAGIKKNVNNFNKCRKPFTNEAIRTFWDLKKLIKPNYNISFLEYEIIIDRVTSVVSP